MTSHPPFDWRKTFAPTLAYLRAQGLQAWAEQLTSQLHWRFEDNPHGDIARWHGALCSLPPCAATELLADQPTVTLDAPNPPPFEALEPALRGLMPWRKGPFQFFDTFIDTEWRSDWKWDRVSPYLSDLRGRHILDVGCGSGYHLWRMYGAGAARVIGIDPGLLFLFQFLAVKHYAGDTLPVDFLPVKMEDLPAKLEAFDTVFSMGVLYHRRSPIDHLLELRDALKPGGELVLETLVVDGPEGYSLMPEDRYGMMRNVWFLPSCDTLMRWVERAGFRDARVVDVSVTTTDEQRQTDWMRFQSLTDFLDPGDPSKTIEGYPGPKRAVFVATR
ncbi:MAG: tRNA 5-methoxyuridine(34)/uridine 5-oxyacetic acid(34) synthase CmoB [Marinobacter sp.]|nr:tRNA 5-methoxyuridine(34)/uridine 5-oxyacetic acid(34) synthase CmoB [Marinobacter sp.]